MLLYTSLLSILFSLILTFNNWRVNRNAALLGLAFLTVALYGITHYVTAIESSSTGILIFYNHFTPFYLLTGPLVYFYVRGTLRDDATLHRSDVFHFLPAVIQLIGILPWIFMPVSDKKEIIDGLLVDLNRLKVIDTNLFFTPPVATGIRFAHLTVYLAASMVLWWKFSRNKKGVPTRQLIRSYRWIAVLLISLLTLDAVLIAITWDGMSKDIHESYLFSRNLQMVSGFFYAALPLSLLFFPQLLYGMPALDIHATKPTPGRRVQPDAAPAETGETKTAEPEPDVNNEPFHFLAQQIREHMETNKPFTRPDYKIDDLALELNVPVNHIAYCLSEVMQQKFTTLRMAYRVEYSKTLLNAGQNERYTIEGIALKAGFGSRSNFYTAFREITGMSPTEFLALQASGNGSGQSETK